MDLATISRLLDHLKERGVTVEQAITDAEVELKLLRGLKAMTATPKESAKPRASRKAKGEAAAEKGGA